MTQESELTAHTPRQFMRKFPLNLAANIWDMT